MSSISRRRFIAFTLLNTSVLGSVGCGTILHPERRGQPAGPLDWKIVALDALGLLLFFIPGVIAFAVDFSNGTIYLPPDHLGSTASHETSRRLVTLKVSEQPLTIGKLEEIVSEHMDQEIRLNPGGYETTELNTIDDFWATVEKHEGRSAPPTS